MSIDVYTGVPGSGKSLHAAADIRISLARRYPRPVIANFPLAANAPLTDDQRALYTYLPNSDMTAGRISGICDDFWHESGREFREDYITLVLDECQLIFNSRRWSDRSRMAYLEFLSQSRKFGVRVVLVTQSVKMIDNQFRMLIEREFNHRRIKSMGPVGWLVAAPFGGRLFLIVRYLFQANERLGMDLFRGSKRDMMMYDSYIKLDRSEE